MNINNILLKSRKLFIIKSDYENNISDIEVLGFIDALASLGYVPSNELIKEIKSLSKNEFIFNYNNIIPILEEAKGAHVKHLPMFKGFPTSVLKMSALEYEEKRYLAYLIDVVDEVLNTNIRSEYSFDEIEEPITSYEDKFEFILLTLGTKEDYYHYFFHMMQSLAPINKNDQNDLVSFIKDDENALEYIPDNIRNKEILSLVISTLITKDNIDYNRFKFNNPKDILRVAKTLSLKDDENLFMKIHFKKFNHKEKRFFLNAFENIDEKILLNAFYKNKEEYKRLLYGLEIRSKKNKIKYPKTNKVLDCIYNRLKVNTYENELEKSIKLHDLNNTLTLLKQRPGEFARRLDKVLRDFNDNDLILTSFNQIIDQINTKNLWNLYFHFKRRNNKNDIRYALPLSIPGKVIDLRHQKLKKINDHSINLLLDMLYKAILRQYKQRHMFDYVYLNTDLKNYIMPIKDRDTNSDIQNIVRGTRIKLDQDFTTLRAFVYWVGKDVDLSCLFLDEKFKILDTLDFESHDIIHNEEIKLAALSGDITYAPLGASEFIDIYYQNYLKTNPDCRYIIFNVISYSGINFNQIKECFGGLMLRSNNTGQIFEPKSVKLKSNINSNTTCSMLFAIDTLKNELIWLDIPYSNKENLRAIDIKNDSTILRLWDILYMPQLSIYDVIKAHIIANDAKEVSKDCHYENMKIFDIDKGITPFDTKELVAKYL